MRVSYKCPAVTLYQPKHDSKLQNTIRWRHQIIVEGHGRERGKSKRERRREGGMGREHFIRLEKKLVHNKTGKCQQKVAQGREGGKERERERDR